MKYNLSKLNLILMGVSVAIIVLGFVLMSGAPSGAEQYNADIFSMRRITIGPMTSLLGFVLMVVAIFVKPKNKKK